MNLFLKLTQFFVILFLVLIVGIYCISFVDWVLNHKDHDFNSKDQYCSCSI